jgi:hypothetical protein
MNRSQLVFGLVFVGLGILLLADQAGAINAWTIIADWWPTLVIVSGVAQLVTRPRNNVGGLLLILFGGALLAWTLGAVASIGLVWPVLLIGLGVWLLAGRLGNAEHGTGRIELSAIVDDRTVVLPPGPIASGSTIAVLGDLTVDLRAATLDAGGATLDTITVFGDLQLDIPANWQLQVSGPELLGDVDLDRVVEPPPDGPVLRLRVLTAFGDITVRSRPDVPRHGVSGDAAHVLTGVDGRADG